MQVSVTFRNLESKEVLREYAQEKMAKLNKYLDSPLEGNVILVVEKHRHIAEVNLVAQRVNLNAREETEDMFSAIDRAVDKLERQLLKHKEKVKRHKVNSSLPEFNWRMDIYAAGSFNSGIEPKLIKSKKWERSLRNSSIWKASKQMRS